MVAYAYLPFTTINHIIVLCLIVHSPILYSSTKNTGSWFSTYKQEQEQLIELTPKQHACSLCITHELPGTIFIQGWHQNHIAVTIHKKTQVADDADRIHCILTENKNGTVILATKIADELHKRSAMDLTVHVPIKTTISIKALESVTIENTHSTIRIQTEQGDLVTNATWGAVHAQITKGNIIVEEAHGSIDVYTQRGSISIQNSYSSVIAETDRGAVDARCAQIPSTATINLITNRHGTVTVAIPESTQAHIVADTTRGSITSNILVTLERHTTLLNADTYKDAQKHVRGIIGEQGNANITIQSVRGIHITPTDGV